MGFVNCFYMVVGLTMNIISICIFLVIYGRMIEIYLVTSIGPIPLATMVSNEVADLQMRKEQTPAHCVER